jgi:hypothetical protein
MQNPSAADPGFLGLYEDEAYPIEKPDLIEASIFRYPPDEMEFYLVSREVNSPAVDKASNIEPIREMEKGSTG